MPARVGYFTGTWDPAREAISKEVQALRQVQSPPGRVVAMSAGNKTHWPRKGVFQLSHRRWLMLRVLAALVESRADVSHVFGTPGAWHVLRAVGRVPTVFTIVADGQWLPPDMYRRVTMFAAESESLASELVNGGIAVSRVRVIYPGVDLRRFTPAPASAQPFRILFASTPSDPAEFEGRGIPLLIELARRVPDVEVTLLWRKWGDQRAARRALAALRPPSNVVVDERDVTDIVPIYQSVHAVAACFARGVGKASPNSVIEGLACGRPAIVSQGCGVAALIDKARAGCVSGATVADLVDRIDELRCNYNNASRAARDLAVSHFDLQDFLRAYAGVYETVLDASNERSTM